MTYAGHAYGGNAYGSSAASTSSGDATVTATAIEAVAAVPAPSVQVGDSATVAASVVATTVAVPAPVVGTGSGVTATAVAAVAAVPAPSVTARGRYDSAVLADDPLIYWRLGESSGTTAADDSGNSRDGTYVAGPTLGVAGSLTGDADTAATFNGSSQYVTIADAAWMDVAEVSVERWVKGTYADDHILASRAASSGSVDDGNSWLIYIQPSDSGKPRFFVLGADNTTSAEAVSSVGVMDDEWHHVVGTHDGSTIRIYVDGVQTGATPYAQDVASGSRPIRLAADALAGAFSASTGDEFAVYGTALSSTRVLAHYLAGVPGFPITPTAVAAVAAVPEPTVASSSQANVNATAIAAVASVPNTFVGDDNALIAATVIAATVAIPTPSIATAIQIGTETRDPSVGGRLRLSGYVTVEAVPAVPTPTTTKRVLKRVSQTYPDPTLTDGRPG